MEKAAGSAAEALGRSLQLEARAVGLRGREDEKLGVCAGAQAVLASGFDGAEWDGNLIFGIRYSEFGIQGEFSYDLGSNCSDTMSELCN
ncbi:hypothetical protein RchiOBHm_Chr3g0451041 [Rosa chinensis]|uniref:Uncharacterized protein n=1 Tax=Rosa chinensis TaxID=74649 RepID=A0A2P6R5X5_ROSCH|nr:hypothetical protein RchiOBHm_Chr3g0451041 [Rosa chinensis]